MAVASQGPAMELQSRSDAEESPTSADNKERPADHQDSSKARDTFQPHESPPRTIHKLPPKNGIPPKRLSMMTKRQPPATPTAASRSTTLTTPHVNPGTGLSKPPTRLFPSSSVRRNATSATAATAASSSHTKRPSVSSVDKRKSDDSVLEENTKPSINQSECRGLKADFRNTAASLSSTNCKASLASGTNKEKGTSSVFRDSGSPTNTALRTATNSSRSTLTQKNSKTTRPPSSSTRTAIGSSAHDARKKRLSTIPASPVPKQVDSAPSQSSRSPSSPVKQTRPGLGTRNSTMSVTIEQRLREMELVHQMLHVAMAEDGHESDEVKEEYGKRVDESLASLRTKLEEARRNEGLEPREVNKGNPIEVSETLTSNGGINRAPTDLDKLEACLGDNKTMVATLTTELAAMQSILLNRHVYPNEALENVTEAMQRLQHQQGDVEKARTDHVAQLEDLAARHKNELVAAHNKLDQAEQKHEEQFAQSLKNLEEVKRVADLHIAETIKDALDSHLQKHKAELESLEDQLAKEKTSRLGAASSIQELQSEISTLQDLVATEKQTSAEATRRADQQHADILKDKEQASSEKDERILNLEHQIRDLSTAFSNEIEEAKSGAQEQKAFLESELLSLREKLDEHEADQELASTAHGRTLAEKDRQLSGLGQTIEGLQTKIQQLHETKTQDVDETKSDLIGEHDRLISDLQRIQREGIDTMVLAHKQKLDSSQQDHLTYKADNDQTVAELRDSLQWSESALEGVRTVSTESFEIVDNLKMNIRDLESERDEIRAAKMSLENAFNQASDEILSLKKSLGTIDGKNLSKDEQHLMAVQKVKDELDATATELQNLRESHVESMESHKKKSDGVLQDLQRSYDELLATWNQAEIEHQMKLEKLAGEHKETLKKHAQDLEDLKLYHSKDIDELKAQFERHRAQDRQSFTESHAEKAVKTEKKHIRDINELQQLHEGRFISLRNELEGAENDRSLVAQKAHAATVSDLQSQVEEQKQKSEELRSQLVHAQTEVTQATEEVAGLAASLDEAKKALLDTTESDRMQQEMFELTKQHADEVIRIQENTAADNERREKERKQGAEVRDRLVAESERLRTELQAANDKTAEQQKLVKVQANKAQEANQKLSAVCQAADRHKKENRKTLDELKSAQDELEKLKAERSEIKEELADVSKQLDALEAALKAERQNCAKLGVQLHEAQAASEKHATRVREVECALKVTTAELVELQTKRPNGIAYSASPAPKSGLRSSRWGVLDHIDEDDSSGEGQDMGFGSVIEGNQMAGLKEQVRQLDDLNEDMIEDAQRFLRQMSRMTSLAPTTDLVSLDEGEEEIL